MNTLIWKPAVSRVIECIIGTFNFKLTSFLINICFNNFEDLLVTREGYFILRILVKIAKEPQLQNRLIEKISSNLKGLMTSRNGSLICQCLLHNLPITTYSYYKSCSSKSESNDQIYIKKDFSNQALKTLIDLILKNWELWDDFHMNNILECAVKNSSEAFEKELIKILQKKKNFLSKALLSLSSGKKIYKLFMTHFSNKSISIISKTINADMTELQKPEWNFLEEESQKSHPNRYMSTYDIQSEDDEHPHISLKKFQKEQEYQSDSSYENELSLQANERSIKKEDKFKTTDKKKKKKKNDIGSKLIYAYFLEHSEIQQVQFPQNINYSMPVSNYPPNVYFPSNYGVFPNMNQPQAINVYTNPSYMIMNPTFATQYYPSRLYPPINPILAPNTNIRYNLNPNPNINANPNNFNMKGRGSFNK